MQDFQSQHQFKFKNNEYKDKNSVNHGQYYYQEEI